MKIIDPETLDDRGRMMLLYGETGVGKTVSILASAPGPCLWLPMEKKDVKRNYNLALEVGNLKPGAISIAYYESWDDTMAFLSDPENIKDFASIFIDGLTHLMSVDMMVQIEDQSLAAMKKDKATADKANVKSLAYMTKGGIENYGTLLTMSVRLINVLTRLHEHGKCVIFSALLDDSPKWNRELSAAPLITGKAFSRPLPQFFGTVGMVVTRLDKQGKLVYPPGVMLRSDDGSFMARFTGRPGTNPRQILDINKLLEL